MLVKSLKKSVFFILFIFCLGINNSFCKSDTNNLKIKKFFENVYLEILVTRSVIINHEPLPTVSLFPYSGPNRAGYILRPSYSFQMAIHKKIKIYKYIFLNSGIQYKHKRIKYEKGPNWNPSPFKLYNPDIVFSNYSILTLSNYLEYNTGKNSFLLGFNLFALDISELLFDIKYKSFDFSFDLYASLLFRYERSFKVFNIKKQTRLILEIEPNLSKIDYIHTKIGLSYNIY
jgi:hypothetical protein